jgi:putative transposase
LPDKHRRRSVRLKGYDYAEPGAYFVTVCMRDRVCLFGHVMNGEMHLNEAGEVARQEWFNTAAIRPYVRLNENECVVMPNHMHAIVWIVDNGVVGANDRACLKTSCGW